jgi:hypothetical protein
VTILSLFPSHRRLLAQVERVKSEKIRGQDEIRSLNRKLAEAEVGRAEAVARAALAWEQIANWVARRSGLGDISSAGATDIPDIPQPEAPVVTRPPMGRDEVNAGFAQFEEDLRKFQEGTKTDAATN